MIISADKSYDESFDYVQSDDNDYYDSSDNFDNFFSEDISVSSEGNIWFHFFLI